MARKTLRAIKGSIHEEIPSCLDPGCFSTMHCIDGAEVGSWNQNSALAIVPSPIGKRMMSKRDSNSRRNLRGVQILVGLGLVIGFAFIVAGERIGSSEKRASITDTGYMGDLPKSGTTGSR